MDRRWKFHFLSAFFFFVTSIFRSNELGSRCWQIMLQDSGIFEMLGLAQELGVEELWRSCEDHVSSTLSPGNACALLTAALDAQERVLGKFYSTRSLICKFLYSCLVSTRLCLPVWKIVSTNSLSLVETSEFLRSSREIRAPCQNCNCLEVKVTKNSWKIAREPRLDFRFFLLYLVTFGPLYRRLFRFTTFRYLQTRCPWKWYTQRQLALIEPSS